MFSYKIRKQFSERPLSFFFAVVFGNFNCRFPFLCWFFGFNKTELRKCLSIIWGELNKIHLFLLYLKDFDDLTSIMKLCFYEIYNSNIVGSERWERNSFQKFLHTNMEANMCDLLIGSKTFIIPYPLAKLLQMKSVSNCHMSTYSF